jgi:hypothetical protein
VHPAVFLQQANRARLLIVAGPSARPVPHIRHTAIYHLPAIG